MTNDMYGIETTNLQHAIAQLAADGDRRQSTARFEFRPLQGWVRLVGPSSQGIALGWRVVAPLARKPAGAVVDVPRRTHRAGGKRSAVQPEGLQFASLGQRPRNSVINKSPSPERATLGIVHARARDLEQTITGQTAAEIIHARADSDKPHMGPHQLARRESPQAGCQPSPKTTSTKRNLPP